MSLAHLPQRFRLPLAWRWVGDWVWRLEHAFERARAAGRPQDDARIRIFIVTVVFGLAFLVLVIGAAHSAMAGPGKRVGALANPEARGDLVDRNGALLAVDLLHWDLYVDPTVVWDTAATRSALVRALPGIPARRIDKVLAGDKQAFLAGGLTPAEKDALHDLGLPGLVFAEKERRSYPLGQSAAHLIGFSDTGGQGVAGAERALGEPLHAAAGGGQVPLAIDMRVQGVLEDELGKAVAEFNPRGAVGIVTDVHSGEILGLANWPDFDPNRPGASPPDYQKNLAAAAVYEMGSTFKAFTVAIGLDTGVATPQSTFDARTPFKLGYRTIHDYHAAKAILTLVQVFQHSSNIGTAKLAESIGPQRLERYFSGMGLTKRAKVDLIESAQPLTPKKWDDDAVASTSFGHGMNVTPLALTAAYGSLLNGGIAVPLTIKKLPPGARPQGQRVFSEATSAEMLKIMRANVADPIGSGGSANAPGLSVGGKTGTGEKWDPEIRAYSKTKQVSSFAATFPTEGTPADKRYFVLILLDEPHPSARSYGYSTGGWVAAPAAGRVINRIAPYLGVQRHYAPTVAEAPTVVAAGPPVAGDGM
ncbi:MAG: penicillin-binding protein 2 [Caulobacterales bacterium]|mgnify:CR=1 FL=1|nr:penicillin-binding protein 2 [Caulobacterales bacterium]